jgi:hypothetical protein
MNGRRNEECSGGRAPANNQMDIKTIKSYNSNRNKERCSLLQNSFNRIQNFSILHYFFLRKKIKKYIIDLLNPFKKKNNTDPN